MGWLASQEAGSAAYVGQTIERSMAWAGSSEEAAEAVRECVDILNVWARKSTRMVTADLQTMLRVTDQNPFQK